jgi:hypothetical protein
VGLGHHRRSSGDGNKRRVVVVEALVAKSFCGYTRSMDDDGLLDGLDRRRSSHRPGKPIGYPSQVETLLSSDLDTNKSLTTTLPITPYIDTTGQVK